jgi:hypothetical protein
VTFSNLPASFTGAWYHGNTCANTHCISFLATPSFSIASFSIAGAGLTITSATPGICYLNPPYFSFVNGLIVGWNFGVSTGVEPTGSNNPGQCGFPILLGTEVGSDEAVNYLTTPYRFSISHSTGLWLPPTCPVINVSPSPGAPYGPDKLPQSENATFTPTDTNGSLMSLTAAATACGFSSFNFVQTVTADAHPLEDSAGNVLSVPYSDPPPPPPSPPGLPGGYFGHPDDAYPFFWNQNDLNGLLPCHLTAPAPPLITPNPLVETTYTLSFQDCPAEPQLLATDPAMGFTSSLVGVLPSSDIPSPPLFMWTWTSRFNGSNTGGVSQRKSFLPTNPNSGTGGVTVTSINGVQLPSVVPPSQVATTASGLAYSRVSQTFNGTVTLRNIGTSAISGPLQIVFFGIPANVTLVNATNNLSGTPYLTVPEVAGLAPGQSVTVNVQFKNPANATINLAPLIYSGGIN